MSELHPIQRTPSTLQHRGYGMDTRRLWLCGHRHRSGIYKGRTPYRCAACVERKSKP